MHQVWQGQKGMSIQSDNKQFFWITDSAYAICQHTHSFSIHDGQKCILPGFVFTEENYFRILLFCAIKAIKQFDAEFSSCCYH
jgi:hypothetical protein